MSGPVVEVPEALRARSVRGEAWSAWLDALPGLAREVVEDWGLRRDGPPTHGEESLVLPVRTTTGAPAVVKISRPHEGGEHEHLALQHWHGRGAVELFRADPRRRAMLLERAAGPSLTRAHVTEACRAVAELYAQLHVPAPPQLRRLSEHVRRRTDELAELPRSAPLPRRLVEQAVALGHRFADDAATDGTMLHTDLHYAKVLAADRSPWLAVGPRPLSGDPHYEVAPLLSRRWQEVVGSGDVRRAVLQRLHTVADAADLELDRTRDWVIVREVHAAVRCIRDATGPPGGPTAADRERVTRAVAVAKAVQD